MTFRSIPLALGVVSLFGASGALTSAPAQTPVARPGDTHLFTAHLTNQEMHFQMFTRTTSDTAERLLPGTSEEHYVVQGPDLLLIKSSVYNGRSFLDTMQFRRAGLVPAWEHMYSGGNRTEFTYAGNRVHSVATHGDSVVRAFDSTFAVPVFGFNQLETLLQSLPLRVGYQAILPLFSEGSIQLEMDTATVTGEDHTAPSGAQWTVRYADPVIVITFGIDMKTRAIESYNVVQRATGTRFRRTQQ